MALLTGLLATSFRPPEPVAPNMQRAAAIPRHTGSVPRWLREGKHRPAGDSVILALRSVLARLLSSAGAQRTCRKSEERERVSLPAIWSRVDLPQAAPNISIGRKVRPRSNPKSRSASLRRGRAKPGEELPGLRRQERRLGGVYACRSFGEHHGRILTAYERVAAPLRKQIIAVQPRPARGTKQGVQDCPRKDRSSAPAGGRVE